MFPQGNFINWLSAALLAAGLTASALAAPKKKAVPPSTPAPAAEAQLRLWKGDFPSKRSVQVSLRTQGRKAVATEIVASAEGLHFTDYSGVPSGACIIELTDTADGAAKLATLSATLAPDSFSTLLVQEGKDGVTAEILDDRPRSTNSCELLVRNFHPDIASLQVDAGDDVHVKINSPEAFLQIRGLPPKKAEVRTSGVDSSGKTFHASNEVDFAQFRRATILLQPDTYGRIRPRVTIDGQFAKSATPRTKK